MSITSANAVFTLAVAGLDGLATPQNLQQFSADDIFTAEAIAVTQAVMGVDGIMTAGYTPMPTVQVISLMADSVSAVLFDNWKTAMDQAKDVFYANGVVILSSTGSKWTLTKGTLTSYKALPDAAKVLGPRRFGITWQSVVPVPTAL